MSAIERPSMIHVAAAVDDFAEAMVAYRMAERGSASKKVTLDRVGTTYAGLVHAIIDYGYGCEKAARMEVTA